MPKKMINSYIKNDNETTLLNISYNDKIVTTIFNTNHIEKVQRFNWRISKKKNKFYVCSGTSTANGGKGIVYLHNLICEYIPDGKHKVDHKNGNSLDNRDENLRIITRMENIQNSIVRCDNNTTKIRGISYDKRFKKYTVDFHYYGRRMYFRCFKNLSHAAYIRYLCETTFIGETANTKSLMNEFENLSSLEKESLYEYFSKRKLAFLNQ